MSRISFFSRSTAGTVLLILDVIALLLIFGIVHPIHVGYQLNFFSLQLYGVIAFTCLVLYMLDVYRIDYDFPSIYFPLQGIAAVAIAGLVFAAFVYLLPQQTRASSENSIYWRGVLVVSMAIFACWVAISRFCLSALYSHFASMKQWLIIGNPDATGRVIESINAVRQGERFVEVSLDALEKGFKGKEKKPDHKELFENITETKKWAGIILANQKDLSSDVINILLDAKLAGIRIYDISEFYETFLLKVPIHFIHDQWLVNAKGFDIVYHNAQLRLKQIIDIVIALILLIPAIPLSLIIALAIALDSRGNVIYAQERVGLVGRVFRIYKFRTMVADAERNGAQWTDHNDKRITRVGRILRPSRLDELPQLWNVLKGDMSFIGPRPERPAFTHELEKTIPYYGLRVLVKPGITGWAQVQYPYGSSIEDARMKLEYDLFYIKNYSIPLDIAILIKTMRVVMFRSGR